LCFFVEQHEGTYLNICRHYRAIYDTPVIKENPEERLNVLKHVALFVVLSPYDNEQSGRLDPALLT
jgi:26S proteasome regulatory subunit N5